ncbi:MAG: TlpA family protein disulfide reductase [Odoribacteraceae bacterium]|nr:TlpA family protein disulfide reductase [Odoribacteraceae bacterium]
MRKATVLMLFLACALSCVKSNEGDAYEKSSRVKVGDEIPEFTASDGTTTLSKSDLAGKKTLLVLFASTCGDCREALPVIEAAWTLLKDHPGAVVAAISRGETAGVVREYWEEARFTMPYYLDEDRAIFNKFASAYTPRVYLIDARQRVIEMYVESLPFTGEELSKKVEAL